MLEESFMKQSQAYCVVVLAVHIILLILMYLICILRIQTHERPFFDQDELAESSADPGDEGIA